MKTILLATVALLQLLPGGLAAQTAGNVPDLTGIWSPYRAGRRGGGDPKLAAPPPTPLVLKPEYEKPYEERRKREADAAAHGEQLATQGAQCIPYGMPTMMQVAIYPVEFIQTPKQITIISEAFSEVRRVYMNVPQKDFDDVAPGYYGRSVGKWDGDTLVVDTIGLKPSIAGYRGMPHSEKMRITERIRLVDSDHLHDQITIDDPVVLEKPVTYTLAYKRLQNYEMVEFVCDNNREYIDDNGVVRMQTHNK